ncbi:spore coat U domain-containing protein [Luminiphilus sp.]|nr:spore coat U domain-containing protein [Luminiphilus sp.]
METKFKQSKLKGALVSAVLVGTASLTLPAYAATATGTMAVSTSVLMSCNISAGAMTFASYDPTASADNDATATITSTCTTGGAAVITMGQGNADKSGSTAASPLRAMFNAEMDEELLYQVYSDSAGGTVWGDTAATGKAITADGTAQAFTAYGRIPKNQTGITAGTFTDSVAVTLTY